jgi:hypothetical protein
MSPLRDRIATLEARDAPRGPLLISWRLNDSKKATAVHDGHTYTQGSNEPRDAFFRRLTENISSHAIVWVNELDGTL